MALNTIACGVRAKQSPGMFVLIETTSSMAAGGLESRAANNDCFFIFQLLG